MRKNGHSGHVELLGFRLVEPDLAGIEVAGEDLVGDALVEPGRGGDCTQDVVVGEHRPSVK